MALWRRVEWRAGETERPLGPLGPLARPGHWASWAPFSRAFAGKARRKGHDPGWWTVRKWIPARRPLVSPCTEKEEVRQAWQEVGNKNPPDYLYCPSRFIHYGPATYLHNYLGNFPSYLIPASNTLSLVTWQPVYGSHGCHGYPIPTYLYLFSEALSFSACRFPSSLVLYLIKYSRQEAVVVRTPACPLSTPNPSPPQIRQAVEFFAIVAPIPAQAAIFLTFPPQIGTLSSAHYPYQTTTRLRTSRAPSIRRSALASGNAAPAPHRLASHCIVSHRHQPLARAVRAPCPPAWMATPSPAPPPRR